MISSKDRASLRKLANSIDAILHIGKGGVGENVISQANEALTARELIKGKVLENSLADVRQVAEEIASATGAEVVQVIGTKFVLYRENPKDRKIFLK